MNEVLEAMGHPTHDIESYRRMVGDGVTVLARRALPPGAADDDATVEEAVRRMRTVYGRRWLETTRPYAGVPELLAELRRRELSTAVLSNKRDDATRFLVGRLFPDHRFDLVRGERAGVPLKPDPAAALAMCAKLEVRPDDVLYVGDTDTDVETGLRAHFVTIGAAWGFRDAAELQAAGAAAVIDHPLELLQHLDGR